MKNVHLIIFMTCCLLLTSCIGAKGDQNALSEGTPSAAIANPIQTTASPTEDLPTQPPNPTPTATLLPPTEEISPTVEATSVMTDTNITPTLSPTPEETQPPEQPTVTPPPAEASPQESTGCTDIAAYYEDVTIPDGTSFRQGESFVKTWRIRNAGTCDWDNGYSLVFAGGEVMNAPMSNPIEPIHAGEIIDISITLTAPPRGGTYRSNWEFRSPSGEHFGVGSSRNGPLWAEISVLFFVATPETPEGGSAPTPQPEPGACPATRDPGYEQQILTRINQGRASLGLDPLILQEQLTAAALEHSTDMACNDFVDHIGSDGNLWYARVEKQGYANYNSSRENIYVGNPQFGGTPDGAYQWWFNSSIHYANMFNPDISEIGIAYVSNPEAEYVGYYTTVFARP